MEISARLRSSNGMIEAVVATDGRSQAVALPAKPGGGSAVNGGELLMLALATCYCNDLYREAQRDGITVDGVEVEAQARFPGRGVGAANVRYDAKVTSSASKEAVDQLMRNTDAVAEIHRSLRAGTYVGFEVPAPRPERHAAPADAGAVALREITADTVRKVLWLSVGPGQERFVAPNAVSLAQALFSPEAWYRAVYRGEELVGFVMVSDEAHKQPPKENPEIGLWRLMVDQRYQGQGIGKEIVKLVAEHARSRGYAKLFTSYVAGPDGPEQFYLGLGFVPTGEIDHGETVAALELGPGPPPQQRRPG
jgi:diamine N-acetyltransferase